MNEVFESCGYELGLDFMIGFMIALPRINTSVKKLIVTSTRNLLGCGEEKGPWGYDLF